MDLAGSILTEMVPYRKRLQMDIKPAPSQKYRIDADGYIRFSVTSNGRTGDEWIHYFEQIRGYAVSKWAKSLFSHVDFRPTNGVVYNTVIIPVSANPSSGIMKARTMLQMAREKGLALPPPELGPLIRDFFTDLEIDDMGFWYIVIMHEPIVVGTNSAPSIFEVNTRRGQNTLNATPGAPGSMYMGEVGFAFMSGQI
jgi:hypothetical protein